MSNATHRFAEPVFLLLRLAAGLMFAFHGLQKVFGIWSEFRPAFPTQMWFGGVIELVAGTLIAAGLWARCAAFVASGEMAVAYTQFHWKLAMGKAFFPGINKGEMAVLYCVLFLYIAARGAGPFSLDGLRGGGGAKRR
jgi:putative oxidoreductase